MSILVDREITVFDTEENETINVFIDPGNLCDITYRKDDVENKISEIPIKLLKEAFDHV